MSVGDIPSLSAVALSRALHARTLRATEVMEAYLQRIATLNPLVNAIVSLRGRDVLLGEARAADADLDAGRSRGWLTGLPLAVKDLSNVAGLPTSMGSLNRVGTIAATDDLHVARCRAAGAIFIGKTNTPEMALGSHTYNAVFGATRNPFDLGRSAGGSSGGAAAALACRLLPVADGSDMMGSLRNPAAFNAVVGFRPSIGRVPDPGADLFLTQLSTIGPMGRTVADVAALLETQAGADPRAPLSLGDPLSGGAISFPKGRVGWLGDFDGYLPVEPEVMGLCAGALAAFDTLGVAVEPVPAGFDMAALWRAWCTLRHFLVTETLRADHEDPVRRARMKPEACWEVETGLGLSAREVFAASLVRSDWYRYLLGLYERFDFLILPAAQLLPFDVAWPWPETVAGRRMDTYHRWMEVVIGPSMAGLPVAALPAGFSPAGLPAGIQLIGPPRADRQTLQAAADFERVHAPGPGPLDPALRMAVGAG